MSIVSRSGVKVLERLSCLKYHNVLKWENRLTLGFTAAKNTNYMKNTLK